MLILAMSASTGASSAALAGLLVSAGKGVTVVVAGNGVGVRFCACKMLIGATISNAKLSKDNNVFCQMGVDIFLR